jgi:hypothetical protein
LATGRTAPPDYLCRVDREAIARAQRRRQAEEALQFEQDRETALREQLEAIVVEQEGPRIDAAAFAAMAPEDVEVVRAALQGAADEPDEDEDWLGGGLAGDEEEDADAADSQEEEIARLEAEIADSRRRQAAFERYLAALGGD